MTIKLAIATDVWGATGSDDSFDIDLYSAFRDLFKESLRNLPDFFFSHAFHVS